MDNSPDTYFASPHRSPEKVIIQQENLISNEQFYIDILDHIPLMMLILNDDRQIVFANNTFYEFVKSIEANVNPGLRLGEILQCDHSNKMEGGCGTSKNCVVCGAAKAINSSQLNSQKEVEECRISLKNGDCIDLLFWSTPIVIREENFLLCTITNIADEKRRKVLERIFFHDLLNTAGGLKGFVSLLDDATGDELMNYLQVTNNLTDQLIDEIQGQRLLTSAENKDLEVNPKPFLTLELLEEIKLLYENFEVSDSHTIIIDKFSLDKVIVSDKSILRRVLGNLTRNALEAIKENDAVKISCRESEKNIQFSIHNKATIPEKEQLQIFQRSFTTKGFGRGVGTYCSKILTENYLQGSISFLSDKNDGTTFFVTIPEQL